MEFEAEAKGDEKNSFFCIHVRRMTSRAVGSSLPQEPARDLATLRPLRLTPESHAA